MPREGSEEVRAVRDDSKEEMGAMEMGRGSAFEDGRR